MGDFVSWFLVIMASATISALFVLSAECVARDIVRRRR